jgi:hypothetical protein
MLLPLPTDALYLRYSFFNFSNEPIPYELKQPHKLASTFISNCMPRNSRNLILDELIRLLPGQIDSFGPCRNTADAVETLKEVGIWDEEDIERSNWNTKVAVSRLYKFSYVLIILLSFPYSRSSSDSPWKTPMPTTT